ncbi:MMPL family transporter, partial [Tsukamurella pulmonis]
MIARLTRAVAARPRTVLAAALLVLIALGVLGTGVGSALKSGGSTDPNAESARAQTVLENDFGRGGSSLVLTVRAERPDAATAAADYGRAITESLRAAPTVQSAVSGWTDPAVAPRLTSADGRTGLVVATVTGGSGKAPD